MPVLLFIVLFVVQIACSRAEADYYNAPKVALNANIEVKHFFLSNERQKEIKATLTTVANPVGFTHVITPSATEGCTEMVRTSTQATNRGCRFAVNAGPFNMDTGACMGSIISNSTVFQLDGVSGYSSFGMTADGRYVFGDVTDLEEVKENHITELVSGFIGPLLVNGDDPCSAHQDTDQVAQRQAVGINEDGILMFLTIDGTEYPAHSMTIPELCDAFKELGAVAALNLDGGGSTTTWMDGDYVNRPTCQDTPLPECERAVASVICIMISTTNVTYVNVEPAYHRKRLTAQELFV